MLHRQVFDGRMEVRHLVATDGVGLLEAEFVGTHIGEVAGIAPTGATVRIPYTVVDDLSPDAITALRAYLSFSVLIGQLRAAAESSVSTGT